jgi:Sec-independent protein translocase protein TatA
MIGALGMPELVVIAFICLLIFGPKALPRLATTLKDTAKALRGSDEDDAHE